MDISKLSGVVPPVVTPLNNEKKFDKQSFKTVLERIIDAQVDGLFILGSTGAFAFLTNKEREEVVANAVEINNERLPILLGCIDTQTSRVIELVRIAEKYNVDGVVITAPFYALDNEEVVENHFRLVKKATKLPLFAYDIPVCVNKKLNHKMLVKLGKDGVLQGVKDSSGQDKEFRQLIAANEEAGHPLRIFTGKEIDVDLELKDGADGVVPGLGNVDPSVYVEIYKAACAQDWDKAQELQVRATKLMQITNCTDTPRGFSSGVGGFLTALHEMGLISTNNVPDPGIPLHGEEVERVRAHLCEAGLI